jgi:hypothetical protein
MGETTRIPLDRLLFLPNVPAGMDWAVIGLWEVRFRKTTEPCDPPVTVFPVDGTDFYRVADGRHRVIAAYIAGREAIEAVIEADRTSTQREQDSGIPGAGWAESASQHPNRPVTSD